MRLRAAGWGVLLALAAAPASLSAQLLGIDLTFDSVAGSVPLAGAGTGTGVLNFGTVSAYQPVGGGVTRASTASDYTLSTQFAVRVTKALIVLSSHYTLRARLTVAQPLTWTVNGTAMTTSFQTISTSQNYGTTAPYPVGFTVPLAAAAGAVSTTIEVMAIAN